jgi:hypothetical protein
LLRGTARIAARILSRIVLLWPILGLEVFLTVGS